MSYFKCPKCGEPSDIFGKGGARKTAEEMGVQFLGEVIGCFLCRLLGCSDSFAGHPPISMLFNRFRII